MCCVIFSFLFFKQNTAYEMRISDWSSDVCSSDLESFTADKHVKEVAVAGMRLGAPDASGRRSPEADPGRKFDVPADMVIKALGFDPEELPHLFGSPDLSVTRWGTLRVDHQTMKIGRAHV